MARRGVRYYRSVPPPESEWAEDYAAIARSGFELVVVPVPFAQAQTPGGGFDFSPLLRQLELARKHGLGVVVAPALESGPEGAAFLRALASAGAAHASLAAYDLTDVANFRCCIETLCQEGPHRPVFAAGDAANLAAETTDWAIPAGDCLPHRAVDYSRAAAGGKRLWVVGLPARATAQVRLQTWSSLVAGEATLIYEAWRPELHAGADAPPALALPDGSPSARLREIVGFDELLARHPELASARPCPAEAAVVILRESDDFWASSVNAQNGYADALQAVQDALSSRGAQVEFAPPDALAGYPVAYLPMPFSVSAGAADALRRYVKAGGCLVAEAGLARFDEQGRTARETPLHGLGEVFGARALDAPEPLTSDPMPTFTGRRGPYPCCAYREPLEATTGVVKATFDDGTAAIVENTFGSGTTRLIGTHPSQGCGCKDDKRYAQVILDSLAFAKVRPRVLCSAPQVCVRLMQGEDAAWFLVAFNTGPTPQEPRVRVSRALGHFRAALSLADGKRLRMLNNSLHLRLPPAEGRVLRLDAPAPRRRWRPGRRATRD